ncbi:homeodomain-interacting protein kinase 1-like [Scomber japonicus]|uniref:homeodomain-interacting protein kinase 1-like n=1 Tax=Scomber japonicus TaxID=13676 RepID=UPI002305B80D|nr:homeodomain-interacting protein kinase 1-like [Scomber japonicus]
MSEYLPIWKGIELGSRFKIEAFLGEGSFGKVAQCLDVVTDTKVAIKVTKDKPHLTKQALEEIKILQELTALDADRCNLVKWDGFFLHEQLICLRFELLDMSLFDYMEQRDFLPMDMNQVRPVLHQLTTALLHLETLKLIHADLKPDNVMVVDCRQETLKVKIIDFGLARHAADVIPGSCTQSLLYRAPEVMLGLDYAEQIDMWSLGLITMDITLGFQLFPGSHHYDMLKFIVDTLGPIPDYLVNWGQYSTQFFNIVGTFNEQTWELKTPEEFASITGHQFVDNRDFELQSLDVLEEMMTFTDEAARIQMRNLLDLVKQMLHVDKNERIIPKKVLQHPFFVEQHSSQVTADVKSTIAEPEPSYEEIDAESVSALLIDFEPEVKTKKRGGRVKRFFKRMKKAVVSFFHHAG